MQTHRAFRAARLVLVLAASLGFGWLSRAAEEVRITVHASQARHRLTRYMTGACIEDVNHEIYGGIYSQMIFGESFQEPPSPPKLVGFTAYEGDWQLADGTLAVGSAPGPKLVSDFSPFANGTVGVELLLPGKSGGVAGLLVKLTAPGNGMDNFMGYEVALDSERQWLVLGRHRHNWEPLQNVPCVVPADQWIPLVVRTGEKTLEILVDGKIVLKYEDQHFPLLRGGIALRSFNRACRYRNLWVQTDGQTKALAFQAAPDLNAGVSRMWRGWQEGSAQAEFSLISDQPFIGRQSQRMTFRAGKGEVGLYNQSLNRWGMHFVAGQPYEGYLWVRATELTRFSVSLQNLDGSQSYAEQELEATPGDWCRLSFVLTPKANNQAGRFAIRLTQPGTLSVGHAFLQPGEWGRFKGLPDRKDVVQGLIDQGLTVLRYGGSMVNAA